MCHTDQLLANQIAGKPVHINCHIIMYKNLISFPTGVEAEPECGRPLGLRFDQSKDNLIVADSFLGLLKVNIKSGKVQTLISAKEGMDGLPLKFLNDLVIASNGVIYVVQSSWKWDETGAGFLVLERGGHGRLMSFNPKTREKEVLLTGLYFGNGIELSENEDHVLVCETTMARIIK